MTQAQQVPQLILDAAPEAVLDDPKGANHIKIIQVGIGILCDNFIQFQYNLYTYLSDTA